MKTETVKLTLIQVNAANPRKISPEKFDKLVNSILVLPKMLELRPIVVDDTLTALGGNMRYRALSAIAAMGVEELAERLHGLRDYQKKTAAEQENLVAYWAAWEERPTAPVIKASELSEDERREFIIKDNAGYGEWDMDALANEWDSQDLDDWGVDVWQDDNGGDGQGEGGMEGSRNDNASLNDRFIVPPFSILDTRKGYWQARKKVWRGLIGDMGESRNDTLISSPEIKYKDIYQRTQKHRKELGIGFAEYLEKYVPDDVKEREASKVLSAGVSLLDPVMAEIVCRWFGLEGCKSFDPFAGDSVFGYVSARLGNEFTGIELRPEQAELNNRRTEGMTARYICDDGQNVAQHIAPDSQDLLFSCPPYFDLERYSDLENDASNQGSYEDFIAIIRNAFTAAIGCLRENRFAVIVVGDVRDKATGFYYDFVGDVKRIFKDGGMSLYNEIILIETGASTALRAGRYMESRKVAKMHQNILVFYKGKPKDIKKHFPKITYSEEDARAFEAEAAGDTAADEDASSDTGGEPPAAASGKDVVCGGERELDAFRKPFVKKRLIMYMPFPRLQQALDSGEIHIRRDAGTGEIIGYLWLKDLKKKPVSKIEEIVSVRHGLGSEMIDWAKQHARHHVIELKVVDYNTAAIDFYQKRGFREVSRETGKKINNITMQYKRT